MKPAPFDYCRPESLDAALQLMGRHGGDARVLAGGQSLVPMMNLRIARPAVLIDLNGISELSGIKVENDQVCLGAMTRQSTLLSDVTIKKHAPLLTCAASHIGHVQTRSRGTVGGSVAHADPSAEIPLIMVTLGAYFKLQSARGDRRVAARDFFVDAMTTIAAEDEILTEIHLPTSRSGSTFAFREFARRHGDFAIVSAAVQRTPDGKKVMAALGAVESVPRFCDGLCVSLSSEGFADNRIDDMIESEVSGTEPLSDLNAGADYRRVLARTLLADCVREVFAK